MLARENLEWKLSPKTVQNSDALKFVLLMDCTNVSSHTVFVKLGGIVHPKLKYNPLTSHPDDDFLIHITVFECHGGKEFYPVEVDCGHVL